MPSKKKKYNSRFPPARIKKIMQSDEEVGKVAHVVPVIISKALEIFVASLLQSSSDITRSRNARTLTPIHIKQSILSSNQFNFLRDLAQTISDVNPGGDGDDEETGPVGGHHPQATAATPAGHSLQRRISENRTITATSSSGHQLSAAGQTAAIGFRGRGRPRKRLIQESQQSSVPSMTSTEEPDEEEDTDETEEEEEDEEEEPQQSFNSDNSRLISNPQIISSNNNNNNNNNNSNSNNNFNVINTNYYYSPPQPTHPSPYVSTIQSTMAAVAAAAASATSSPPVATSLVANAAAIEEDDDYDN